MTRPVSTAYPIEILRDARARTLQLLAGLDGEQLIRPRLAIINPTQWEVGHVVWFYEYFILRRLYGHPALLTNGDDLYDLIAVAHDKCRDLPLLSLEPTLACMARECEGSACGGNYFGPERRDIFADFRICAL